MKIFRAREGLGDDAGADGFSAAGNDLSVGLVFEENLRQSCDQQRVEDSQQNRCGDGHSERGDEMFCHKSSG